MSLLDLFTPSEFALVQQMVNQGCNTSTLGPMTASVNDVRANWKPTGFYTPEQLGDVVTFALQVTGAASDAISKALGILQIEAHRNLLSSAQETQHSVETEAMTFVVAIRQANAGGFKVIESTGLRRWVIRMLEAADETHRVVSVVACARPNLLLDLAQGLTNAVHSFVAFVKTVAGVAIAVVKAAGNLVMKIPDLIGSLVKFAKILPWVALAFGGYYVGVKTELIPPRYDPLRLRERNTWRPWRAH